MSDLNFIEVDANKIYQMVISALEEGVKEDLYPGDERKIYGEALVAVVVALFSAVNDSCRQRLLRYARGETLDALGESRGIERIAAQRATTTLEFFIEEEFGQNIIIPEGTRATSDGIRFFATDKSVVLEAGGTSVSVSATAAEGGSDFNGSAIGVIATMVDQIPFVDGVRNTTVSSGGAEEETDDAYRERIRTNSAALSTAGPANTYKYWAMTADPLVADADISSPSPGVVMIKPICTGGELPSQDVLEKVLELCSRDDIRVLTDYVQVSAPDVQEYDIALTYYTTASDESETIETVEGTGGAIEQYIVWQGGALGRDINPDTLRKYILSPESGTGAYRVDISAPVHAEIERDEVAKFSGTLTVNHIVGEG